MFDRRSGKTGCEGRGVAQRTAVSHGPRDAVAGGPRDVLLLGGGGHGDPLPPGTKIGRVAVIRGK